MKKLLISLTILIFAGTALTSCLKEAKTPDPGYNIQDTGANSTIIQEVPLDLYLQADRAIRFQRDSIIAKNINGATATFHIGYISLTVSPADTTSYPRTLVLDFGASPAVNQYQGKMTITMLGDMRKNGSKCTIQYNNLQSVGNLITGNDTIYSSGKNASGSILSRFNMSGGGLIGANSVKISYAGFVQSRFNQSSNTTLIDSVSLNATDANKVAYRLYSDPTYKLQIVKGCNYFELGGIISDITINGAQAGRMAFDYGYSSQGLTGGCDPDGLVNITSKINLNYNQPFTFFPMAFN